MEVELELEITGEALVADIGTEDVDVFDKLDKFDGFEGGLMELGRPGLCRIIGFFAGICEECWEW